MAMLRLVILIGVLAPGSAFAESDAFLQAVNFALTGSDNFTLRVVDRAKCIFVVGKETFRLNNVHVERIQMQSWKRTNQFGEERWVEVNLHGEGIIYERIDEGMKDRTSEFAKELLKTNPEMFRPSRSTSSQHQLHLSTAESERVKRAWDLVYANGCTGKKSPF